MRSMERGTAIRGTAVNGCVRACASVARSRGALAAAMIAFGLAAQPAGAQTTGWQTDTEPRAKGDGNTTVVPRAGGEAKGQPATGQGAAQLTLSALVSAEGQPIQQGLVWRVYQDTGEGEAKAKLVATHREAGPVLRLSPGPYYINAAFGRANLTRRVTLAAGQAAAEQFILNAGGLKLAAVLDKDQPAPANSVVYDIYSDERDQFGHRTKIMTGAKPGLIIRLNAGIYQVASTYGDANATVRADVTVEAGKLTLATVKHTAARVTFKLVARVGGEALADTQWVLHTRAGELVKESVGALPNHIIAPGAYTIIAKNGQRVFKRDFAVHAGDIAQVEVVMQ